MTEQLSLTKAELMAEMEQSWQALNATLLRLTETEMTLPRDAQGWSVKDHLVHLVFWEQSVVFLLQGRPRHEALGVDEALYLNEIDDEINDVIQQQHKDLALDETLARLRSTHQQLLDLLHPLSDDDLRKPYRHYLPQEPGQGDGPHVINVIYGNSAGHISEHLPWMEALVKG